MLILLTMALQAAAAEPIIRFDLAKVKSVSTTRSPCATAEKDTILVCGKRRDFRLPLPIERGPDGHVRGEGSSTVSAITPKGGCGIFAGQRACSKAEMRRFGYGGGRDPLTLLTGLAKKLLDPDAEVSPTYQTPH